MTLLFFAGSTRQHSHNRRLARVAADMARDAGAQATVLELSEFDIPLYNADLEARGTPADVLRLKEALHAHAGWVISTPEYNGSYPALLKNALDWASSPVAGHATWNDGTLPLRGKVVGLLSASPGGLGGLRAQSHLAPLLLNLKCWVAPQCYALPRAGDAWTEDGQLRHTADQEGVGSVVQQVLWASQRLAV